MDFDEIRTRTTDAKISIEKLEHKTVLEHIRQAGVEDALLDLSAQVDEIENLVDAYEQRSRRLEQELKDCEERRDEAVQKIATLEAATRGSASATGSPASSGPEISDEMEKVYEFARAVRPRILEDPEGKRQDSPAPSPPKATIGRRKVVGGEVKDGRVVGGAFKFEPLGSIIFDTGDTIAVYGRALNRVTKVQLDGTDVDERDLQRPTPNAILLSMPALAKKKVRLQLHTTDGVLLTKDLPKK